MMGGSPIDIAEAEPIWPFLSEMMVTKRGQSVVSASDRPKHVHQITDGWAAQYGLLKNGERQLLGILTAGDFCDLDALFSGKREFEVLALTQVFGRRVARTRMHDLIRRQPEVMKSLQLYWVNELSWLRRLAIVLGRGTALEKVAFILCHIVAKSTDSGMVEDGVFPLPLSQEHIGDLAGLTSVHTNRTIGTLRRSGVIDYRAGTLELKDVVQLERLAGLRVSSVSTAPIA